MCETRAFCLAEREKSSLLGADSEQVRRFSVAFLSTYLFPLLLFKDLANNSLLLLNQPMKLPATILTKEQADPPASFLFTEHGDQKNGFKILE